MAPDPTQANEYEVQFSKTNKHTLHLKQTCYYQLNFVINVGVTWYQLSAASVNRWFSYNLDMTKKDNIDLASISM